MFSNYFISVKNSPSPPKKRNKILKKHNRKNKGMKTSKVLIIDLVQITLTFFPSPTSEGKIYLPTYI